MVTKSSLLLILLSGFLAACNLASLKSGAEIATQTSVPPVSLPFPSSQPPTDAPIEIVLSPTSSSIAPNQAVLDRANQAVQTLKNQDFVSLSGFIHPYDGVRFSPYAYVKDSDQVFSADEIMNILSDTGIYTWGAYSGTGESINLSFPEYYSKFIYDQDFTNAPKVALNQRLSAGNSIDNSTEFYPGAMIVEYYFPGFDPQYSGMDWRSLRLVFSEDNGTWYLVGIIHDEWTP